MSIGTRARTSAAMRLKDAEEMLRKSKGNSKTAERKKRVIEVARWTLEAVEEKLAREEGKA